MKHFYSFLIFFFVISSMAISQSITVGIGQFTSTTYGPMRTLTSANQYNRHAYIYPSSLLTGMPHNRLITSIEFQRTGTNDMMGNPNFKIYMKNTPMSDWGAGGLDWTTAITGATLVYDADPTVAVGNAPGFVTFDITDFTYDTTNGANLAIIVEYTQPTGQSSTINWHYDSDAGVPEYQNNQTKYSAGTGTPSDNLSSSQLRHPQVTLNYIDNTDMAYDSTAATQPDTSFVLRGRNNQLIIGVEIYTSGGLNPFDVTSFTFNTNGTTNPSDITSARLFYTGTSNTFDTTDQFGSDISNPSGSFNINGTQQLSGGTNYFWLTYNVSSSAVHNNIVDAECTGLMVNSIARVPVVTNPGPGRRIEVPLSGDYTIGTTLFNAVTGLNVTFERRVRMVEKEYETNDVLDNPESYENNGPTMRTNTNGEYVEIWETPLKEKNEVPYTVTKLVEEVYYVPFVNGEEYDKILYHEFTNEEKARFNITDGAGVYATITDAINDLNDKGVDAPTRFLLLDATYATETFPITIGEISGSSSVNTVVLLPNTGVTTIISSTLSGDALFVLDGADYFYIDGRQNGLGTIRSLTIENPATTTGSACVKFQNGATYNIVTYCNIISYPGTSATRAFDFSTSSVSDGNSNNLISNNDINAGRYNFYMNGSSGAPNSSNIIRENNIYDFVFASFYMLNYTDNTLIEENTIYQTTTGTSANSAVNISTNILGHTIISRNQIYDIQNTSTSTVRGITLSASDGAEISIINNFISLTLDNGTKTSIYAIQSSGANDYILNIYYNSMRIGGNHTGGSAGVIVSAGYVKSNSGALSDNTIVNNINYNTRTGGTSGVFHTGAFYGNLGGSLDIDYNVYHASGDPGSYNSGWDGFVYTDIVAYQTAASPQEQNSKFKAVSFVSNTDLHLTGASNGDLDLSGIPIPGITVDIDGDPRNDAVPYIGADEASIPLPVELVSFIASVDRRDVHLNWTTATELNNSGFDIERKAEGNETWSKAGYVEGNGTTNETQNYSFTDRGLNTGNYNYRLKQIDYNGNFEYFNLSNEVIIGVPDKYDLSQNYPNPFNPATKINFDMPFDSKVMMKIFDITGREIATLVNGVQPTGYYTVTFDARNIASGMYFYRIIAEGGNQQYVMTKKMMVIK